MGKSSSAAAVQNVCLIWRGMQANLHKSPEIYRIAQGLLCIFPLSLTSYLRFPLWLIRSEIMASTSTPGSASEKLQKLQHMNSTLSNINKILETLLGGEIEGINEREQILLRTDLAVYVMRAKNVLDEAKNMRLIVAIPPLLCSLLVECDDASVIGLRPSRVRADDPRITAYPQYKPDLARAEIRNLKLRIEAERGGGKLHTTTTLANASSTGSGVVDASDTNSASNGDSSESRSAPVAENDQTATQRQSGTQPAKASGSRNGQPYAQSSARQGARTTGSRREQDHDVPPSKSPGPHPMARHSVGRQREQTAGSNARRKSGQLNGKVAGNNENNRSESDESSDDVAPPSPRVKFELQAGTLPKSILKKPQRVYGRGNVGGQIDLIETVNRKRQYRRIMSPACVTCRRHHVGCWISLSPEYVESREGPFACDRCHKNRQACIAPCDDDEYGRRSRSRSRGRSRSVRRHCRSCSCGSSASRSRRSSSRLRSRSRRRSVSFASDVDSSTSSEGDNDESTHSKRKRRSPSHRGRSSKRRQLEPPAGTSSACTSRASGSNRTLDNGPTPSTVDEDLTQEISTLRKDMQGLSANVLVLSNSVGELKRHIASLSKDPR